MSKTSQRNLKPISGMRSPEERFNDFLQSRGMRQTEQRRSMLRFVLEQPDHFDADQLMERMPSRGSEGYVSRPTVYRTLAEFVDAGLLRKFELDGRAVYEMDYGYPQHDHLYCSECESLIEFRNEEVLRLRDEVAKQHGFGASAHRLIITGICQSCRQNRRRVRRRVDRI